MSYKLLTALPVYNESGTVDSVLDEVLRFSKDVLVVDDGSTDGSSARLADRSDIILISYKLNQGYGAALKTAFDFAIERGYDLLVTIDCDGQHQPQRIQEFADAIANSDCDIISGSRYLKSFQDNNAPPKDRQQINQQITKLLNRHLGLNLTDSFCGFKAYRVNALKKLQIKETGYAMPLELWVQAACNGLQISELPVPLIYLDLNRSFGGQLDQAQTRMNYYLEVINRALSQVPNDCQNLRIEPVTL